MPCEEPAIHHTPGIPFLKFYPNPAREYINIAFSLNKTENVLLNIFDQSGHKVDTRYQRFSAGNHTVIMNTRQYAVGIYIISLMTRNVLKTGKFVKVP
jgi:hypothetical protein